MLGDTPGQMGVISGLPPIIEQLFYSGYTPINTIIYGIILAMVVFIIIKMFRYLDIRPISIMIPLIPFILLGSSTRALVDAGIYPYNIFLISPGIYIVVGIFTTISLIVAFFIKKNVISKFNRFNRLSRFNIFNKIDYPHILSIIGLIAIIPNIFNFQYMNFNVVAQVFLVWGFVSLLTTAAVIIFNIFNYNANTANNNNSINNHGNNNKYNNNICNNVDNNNVDNIDNDEINTNIFNNISNNQKINLAILSAHIFDAASTFIAVDFYNYAEQHFVPNVFLEIADSAITMFPLKIIVIGAVLYIIDKYIDDVYIKDTLKLSVFILGLAPGLRNFLTLAFGTA
ncbi:MAG: DUF63 family protein [Methanobacteriaceae archaeon]